MRAIIRGRLRGRDVSVTIGMDRVSSIVSMFDKVFEMNVKKDIQDTWCINDEDRRSFFTTFNQDLLNDVRRVKRI